MNIATIEELAYLLKQAKENRLPQPIVFLGAGASKTGDVPLAGEIAEDIIAKHAESPRIKKLKEEERTYSKLMECLTPFERNKLLKEYIDKAKINVTHIYLAQLLIADYVDYVLTVNFDNLMLRALALFNNFPATYDMAILKDLTTTSFKEKSVVYLHGQHHGLWLLNTKEEMNKVNEIIPPILNSIKDQRPWIFIGYSGEDPIFEHITKLGRFDNGLYWVTLNDKNPSDLVCKELLDKANTNTFLIKGFDADSFMLKLAAELDLEQPLIIDKPFTSLQNTLENIVDIDDKEHFKGVKERLEIVKKDVGIAITQFEKGQVSDTMQIKGEIDAGLLKKQIIDRIIRNDFEEGAISKLQELAKQLANTEINFLLSGLFNSWGTSIADVAKSTRNENLFAISFEKFRIASELNPNDASVFSNWGTAIAGLLKINNDENLYKICFDKFKIATEMDAKDEIAFSNWGSAISDFANIKKDENLFLLSFEKFKIATEINPKYESAFYNWGTAILDFAKLKNDENLFGQSFEKFKIATELNSKYGIAFSNWGAAILILAKTKQDEQLYSQSIEKFKEATKLNHKDADAFSNWGIAISDLAKLRKDEKLYSLSFEKFKIAAELSPRSHQVFSNWGSTISELAKLKNDENLYQLSIEKLTKAVELGANGYNLACAHSISKNKKDALSLLNQCLLNKEIDVDFVTSDEDWDFYKNDKDFIGVMKKYK